VLLHGFGGNKDNFTRVARYLTPKYRVIVPDLLGFGESAHPQEASYAYEAQARRVHDFLQTLQLPGQPHLGGNSMGGGVALSYAAQYRGEVASLWLLDPAGLPEAPASELRQVIETSGRNPLLVSNEEEFAQLLAFAMSDPPFLPRAVMDVMARERIGNQALEKKIFWQIAPESLKPQVTGLATPALIVWGAEDRLLHPGTAELLHGLLAQSQVVVMPKVGHVPMVERPQESAQDYLRFREGLKAR
jgi:pimeloyl-ACP methyl ester carboxylesterase